MVIVHIQWVVMRNECASISKDLGQCLAHSKCPPKHSSSSSSSSTNKKKNQSTDMKNRVVVAKMGVRIGGLGLAGANYCILDG